MRILSKDYIELINLAEKLGYKTYQNTYRTDWLPYVYEMYVIQSWLRDLDIYVTVELDQTTYLKFCYYVYEYKGESNFTRIDKIEEWYLYKTYDEALFYGIKQALNYLNNEDNKTN